MRRPGLDQGVTNQLAALNDLKADDLRRRWQSLTGGSLPDHLPRQLLMRLVAYRLQADTLGDLSSRSQRLLSEIAQNHAEKRPSGAGPPSLESLNLPSRRPMAPTVGTVLVREHNGVVHHVMVVADGFAWGDKTYPSLSAVARAITGTRWNGRRFFGLTDKMSASRSSNKPPSLIRKRDP